MTESLHKIDHSSYELGAVKLMLRRDLSFRRQTFGKSCCYVVEDATTSKFFRIGAAEYTFLSLLDGRTSISEAVAETATCAGNEAFTETQAAALCSWAVNNSLASTAQSTTDARLIERADSAARARRWQRMNPIMLKLPLGNPNRIVQRIAPLTSWIFNAFGFMTWLLVAAFAIYNVSINWTAWTDQSSAVLSRDNWLWLAVAWIVLKLAHELAHAVACRRFGGECRETGVLLLLFVPLPFVDVTSAWRFGSKWQRIIVSAAGMYVEVFIAACAAIIWTQTDSLLIQHHAFNVIVTAGFMTIIFNINPLMRFDGYYILCDLLDIPNLATHGQQDLKYLGRRWLLGTTTNRPSWPEGKAAIIRLYGVAAFAWRILICVSLALAAESLYHGAGIVLATAAVVLWVVIPLANFARYMIVGDSVNPPKRLRFLAVATVTSLLITYGAIYVPYVQRLQIPAIVDYSPIVSVRAATSGFVTRVHVASGDTAKAGFPLVSLEDPQLTARIEEVKLAIIQSKLEATRHHRQQNLASYQIELENEFALNERLAELDKRLHQLVVRAPVDGRVLTANLDDLNSRWVSVGTELVVLGNDHERSLQIVVPQSDIDFVRDEANRNVSFHIWGAGCGDNAGSIEMIEPRGTTLLRHPALAAIAGGPLAVRPATDSRPQASSQSTSDWQLLEPHFNGRVSLSDSQLDRIGTGQRGIVEFTICRGTIGSEVRRRLATYFAERRTLR